MTGSDDSAIVFRLDGQERTAYPGETILDVADRLGVVVPRLCYQRGYRADGNCRACVVEIDGERTLAPSCCRVPEAGMDVQSASERALASQKMVLELLLSDMPAPDAATYTSESEFNRWVTHFGLGPPRFPCRPQPPPDYSHPAMVVNLDACIQCNRCVRACREEQVNDVIGYAYRGNRSKIVFDVDVGFGDSTCVACGECVQACPTGALKEASNAAGEQPDNRVDSACPYCGVGCLLTYNVKDGRILSVDGRDGPANKSRLCVKGRFGFDYVHHPARLTKPLIRRPDAPKTADLVARDDISEYFREADWQEALDVAAAGFRSIRDAQGPAALAGFGSAKGSNEEAYLFQKLVRTGFGTNNVDHCTRLCHASSVAALLETIGSGAVSNQVADGTRADVIMVVGSRPDANHPVAATFMKNAARRGSKIVLIDPWHEDFARYATHVLQLRPATDVSLLNAMMHTIIEEELTDEAFIRDHTEGFDSVARTVADYPPEKVAPLCGIDAGRIREVARLYATAPRAIIFWGMGMSQHVHGTDNCRCLISLALMTGQIGRPGTGLHPLRGQNNVQGASDVGLIPMFYPDYRSVTDPRVRQEFGALWKANALDDRSGLTVVEIMHAAQDGRVRGLYVEGENPAMSDPNLNHARAALANLEHLVVQDIFFTETCSYADVVFPASAFAEKTGTFTNTDRRVQLGRQAVQAPGDARQDWWIIQEMARRLGLEWNYSGPEEVFDEIRLATPSLAGMTWQRLEKQDSLTYPLRGEGDPGEPVIFRDGIFPTPSGRGKMVAAQHIDPAELPDDDYPFVFMTGRLLEHWHTGSMTRRSRVLDALEPVPTIFVNPDDLAKLGMDQGVRMEIESRRGHLTALARPDQNMQSGVVMMPFCFREAAANLITNEAVDPYGKIPELKFCAVRVRAAA